MTLEEQNSARTHFVDILQLLRRKYTERSHYNHNLSVKAYHIRRTLSVVVICLSIIIMVFTWFFENNITSRRCTLAAIICCGLELVCMRIENVCLMRRMQYEKTVCQLNDAISNSSELCSHDLTAVILKIFNKEMFNEF